MGWMALTLNRLSMALNDIIKADLAFSLCELGSTIVYNGFTTNGILINEPIEVSTGKDNKSVSGTKPSLTIITGSIGVIKNTSPKGKELLTVDGKTYEIDKSHPVGNGIETKIWLSGAN